MRAVVCLLVLSSLLAGLTEGYSVKGFPAFPNPFAENPQFVAPKGIQSKESQEDKNDHDDASFIASEETEEGELWASDDDPDWTPSQSQEDEDDGSFIASEETEEGKLWASDDDSDWTPSQSQEDEDDGQEDDYTDEDYSQEDDYTDEDYSQEEDQTHEDYSHEDQTHEDYSQEDQTFEDYSQEDQTFEDYSQEDQTHEDYSQEDQTHEDYSQEDQTFEDYSQEDQTHEDYGQEDQTHEDYSQEDQTHQDYSDEDYHIQIATQQPFPPFPEALVPMDNNVKAELWNSYPGQTYHNDYFKHKRDVQRQYQTGQQVVQVPYSPGSTFDRLDSGYGDGSWGQQQQGAIHELEQGRPGVSLGVEPLLPGSGPHQHEVAAGVEPAPGGLTIDKDKDSGGSSIGGWFQQGWRKVSEKAADLGNKAQDTFRNIGDKVEHAAGHVADKIQQTYQGLREKLPQLVERFKGLLRKSGILIQEGIRYSLRRFDHAVDRVRESTSYEKLERGLERGHTEVKKLFQILGEKVKAWREKHTSTNIDEGLIEGYTQQEQQDHQMDEMPDFFQDPKVLHQLSKLEEVGVLTQEDIIILTQEHLGQNQQNQHQHQHQNQQEQHQNQQEILQIQQEQRQNQQEHQTQQERQILQELQNQKERQLLQQHQNQQEQQQGQHYYDFQQQNQQQSQVNPKFVIFPE